MFSFAWGVVFPSPSAAAAVIAGRPPCCAPTESVAAGYQVFPGRLSSAATRAKPNITPGLSARQQQVLDRLIHGQTLKEIAEDLGISQHTVRTYQERLLEKFGVTSRAELIFAAPCQIEADRAC